MPDSVLVASPVHPVAPPPVERVFARSAADRLLAVTTSFLRLARRAPRLDDASRLHRVIAHSHRLCAAIGDAERDGLAPAHIRRVLDGVRDVHAQSPFVARLQQWPRGYAGDFETIEYICRHENRARPGTLAHAIERYALDSAIAQQHRHKVARQSRLLLDTVRATPRGGARLLALACGSCPDLHAIRESIAPFDFRAVVVDQDRDALSLSRARLDVLGDRVIPVAGNLFRLGRDLATRGPFDAIVLGGLLDYLDVRQAEYLMERIVGPLLAPGGRMLVTNIVERQPFRVWIEYLANWSLIERSEQEVGRLARLAACGRPARLAVELDPTGLAIVATLALDA